MDQPTHGEEALHIKVARKRVDLQHSSILFARLPSELRKHIFELALSEYYMSDREAFPLLRYPSTSHQGCEPHRFTNSRTSSLVTLDYTRPGYLGLKKVHTALLLTCRRAYLETWMLPPKTKEHLFWMDDTWRLLYNHDPIKYFGRRWTTAQLNEVNCVHFFASINWILHGLCPQTYMFSNKLRSLRKVHLTIRRNAWWNRSGPHLDHSSCPGQKIGEVDVPREADGVPEHRLQWLDWCTEGWGYAFQKLKSLREIVLEMEAFQYKEEELLGFVERAKEWNFPANDGGFEFGIEGTTMETWRGSAGTWPRMCPSCDDEVSINSAARDCHMCKEILEAKEKDLGPVLVVYTLKYKLQSKVARNGE